jgi:tetratricopeptide (TPR) repeat protein
MALLVGALAMPSLFLLTAQPATLQPGVALERGIAGGETHSYGLQASPGTRLLITVDQRGIDVEIHVLHPDGSPLIAVDGIVEGPETLLLPAEAAGPFEVRVRSPNPGAAPGSYTLRLEELPAAAPADLQRIEAERLATEAAARFIEAKGDSLRLAFTRYEEAQAAWRTVGDRGREARCALAAGDVETALGQPRQAQAEYRRALSLFTELGDEPGQATAWSDLGVAQISLGDTAGGAASERQAIDLERRLGRPYQEGQALDHLGLALHTQGELREALGYYQQALAVFQRAGEHGSWEGKVLHNLASIQTSLGEPEEALASHQSILGLQRRLGDRRGEAETLNSLGVLYNNLGEFGQAL